MSERRRSTRFMQVTALAASGMLLMTACGGGGAPQSAGGDFTGEYDGPDVTIQFWNGFTGGDGPFMEQMVKDFMAEHDNITVESTTQEWSDFYQKLPAAVTAGEGPDVGVMHVEQLSTMAARSVIVPVDDIAETLDLSGDDFSEEVWDAGVYQDAHYGIPLDVHSLAMYYNTDHFTAAGITEPPTDQASFTEALDKLKAAGFATPFWMPALWPGHLMELSLIWQAGGEPYSEDGGEATFNSDEGVSGLEWMRSMVDQGYSAPDVAIDAQYVAFKNGQTSITWDGIWQINDLTASGLPFAAAPVPAVNGEPAFWASSHQFFLPKQSGGDADVANASKVFIAWMSENSAEWAGAGMIPARESVRETALEGTVQQPIAEQIDAMHFLPGVPGLGTVQAETLEVAVADGVLGKASPEEALTREADRATDLLQENLERFGG